MNRNEKFARRLRELRKEKEIKDGRKWTCDAVGKAIGMTPSGYTNYENALRIPHLDVIEKIATFYNVDPSYIACFTDNKGNSSNGSLLIMPMLTEQARSDSASPLGDYGLSPEILERHYLSDDQILIDIIKDNSMSEHLIKDDVIIIQKNKNPSFEKINFGIYYLKDKNNQYWVRWVKTELDGSYKIYPNNTTHYESFKFSKEEFTQQFEVIGTIFKIIRTPQFDDL
ncbi:helix-turn-helix transcriptional regulator [Vibrio vulnificus]|uniref:helix-turn-helix domain-containing protein n=1 Tax=Vibrio vulnificus TaxID=672 RepID=UPI0024E0222B|nr:helix-turn-helix transcriptional regulator [Vibrio vulnificus]EIE1227669.1 helix-turn-helix domain-containing protein [Vibrio vulnificus]MDK2679250.1 helix-turn-helix transcriptional regulator [Vibrio vulnificus]MDK2688021.1 helix-turn-helix transcriptional regulator [Vibrio vulnificus]